MSALVERAYEHWVPIVGGRPRPMDDDYTEVFGTYEGWVDAEGEAIRGVVVLNPVGDSMWIENVAVDPVAAGAGLGRELLDHAERRARELGIEELRLFTHEHMAANRAIYLHLGWSEFEPEERMADFFVYFRKPVSA